MATRERDEFDVRHRKRLERQRYLKDLMDKVSSASKVIEAEIDAEAKSADHRVTLLKERLAAEERAADRREAVGRATSVGVTRYLDTVVDKNLKASELEAERDVKWRRSKELEPFWTSKLDDTAKYAWNHAHSHKYPWKPTFRAKVQELGDVMAEAGLEALLPDLQHVLVMVNAWGGSELKRALDKVRAQGIELEVKYRSPYGLAVADLRAIDGHLREYFAAMREKVGEQVRGVAQLKADARAVAATEEEHLAKLKAQFDAEEEAARAEIRALRTGPTVAKALEFAPKFKSDPAASAPTAPAPPATTAGARALASTGSAIVGSKAIDRSGPRPLRVRDLTARIRALESSGKKEQSTLHSKFLRLFVDCADAGAWADAFDAHDTMLRLGEKPDQAIYQQIVAACKHARPPNSEGAVRALAELRKRDVPVTISIFNRVIDACRVAGAWRRALVVYQSLLEAGAVPTTATYELLGQACARAGVDDAPDVYAAMKYSGVPEFLAYSAAMQAIQRGKKPR